MKRIVTLLCYLCLLGLLLWPAVGMAQTPEDCSLVHTVQPGENLIRIAKQYGVTVGELVDENKIANPNQIRAGQSLCIPQQSVRGLEAPMKRLGTVEIVAEYRRALPEVAVEWTIAANPMGLRYSFPVAAGGPVTTTIFRLPDDLLKASAAHTPALLLIRNPQPVADVGMVPPSYTLAVIGDPKPLLSVQFPISSTQLITDDLPISSALLGCDEQIIPASVLGRGMAADTQISLELVSPDHTFLRFPVTGVTYWETSEKIDNCNFKVILALHPISGTEFYQMLLVLQRGDGASGGAEVEAIICADWKEGNLLDKLMAYFKCSE